MREAIIDRETWARVQELRKQRKRPNRYGEVGLFSGLLFCADCGSVLYQQRYQTEKRKQDCYICGSYKKRTADCTAHFIRTDYLKAALTENLRRVTCYAADHETEFIAQITAQNEAGDRQKNAAMKKQLGEAEARIGELDRIIKRLYEDNVLGKISDERFGILSAEYETEQKELRERSSAIETELQQAKEASAGVEKFIGIVRRNMGFDELTHTLLREFVQKIVVHEAETIDGERHQQIDIYYSFIGMLDLPQE